MNKLAFFCLGLNSEVPTDMKMTLFFNFMQHKFSSFNLISFFVKFFQSPVWSIYQGHIDFHFAALEDPEKFALTLILDERVLRKNKIFS